MHELEEYCALLESEMIETAVEVQANHAVDDTG